MATTPPLSDESSSATTAAATTIDTQYNDPFNSTSPAHYRFSNFDEQFFALTPDASPTQIRLALEAHLAETDRRMEEAGKLGTALVQQRSELTDRLKEVEKLEAEGELSDELRQRLVEIERDYNEVARKSARAFLPKSRVPSNETGVGSPTLPEGKSGIRAISPSKFEAQAAASPSKLSVPNRKIRNQSSNRIHDIEFAAEISTSLIAQVRNLQGLLAERDEELKEVRVENSKLEYEVEGFQQRLKALDDSEHRYKDENWNLETQIHELMSKEREANDREKKLTQTINMLQAEKNISQQKLDEMKLGHSRLAEEHAAAIKHHDIELGSAKRTMAIGEAERAAMQRKIEDLTGQNQELAKAISASVRGRKLERDSIRNISDEDFQTARDNTTPEQSPPPSPVKITPRHTMLETETLKTSLAHAQRTIQSLRTNVHREKTERLETKRLLQEARDEIERYRNDPLPQQPPRRARKAESKEFKKPPRLLGGLRSARSEIFVEEREDSDWEDQPEALPPSHSPASRETARFEPASEQTTPFETANETSDAAFETANELATESDFQTGAEEFSSDDAETETESPSKRRIQIGRQPSLLFSMQRSASMDSTASTEDEGLYSDDARTLAAPPTFQAKFPLRVSRGAFRRSRQASEEPQFEGSPRSFANGSDVGTPGKPAQSLAAELGDFDGSDNESNISATPSKRSIRTRTITPPPPMPRLPRVLMVDSGMVTEPLHQFSSAELVFSTLHSHGVEPLLEPDMHAAEMEALHTEHEEQLKKVATENALAHAAIIEELESRHSDELAIAKRAFTQELEILESHHAETSSKAIADIHASYTEEIKSLKSKHAEEISKAVAATQTTHEAELESLKLLHLQQLTQKETEAKAAHAADLEALTLAHTEVVSQKESESKKAYDAKIETLKTAHDEEMSQMEHKLTVTAAAELETLKVSHTESLSQFKIESEAVHAAELAALAKSHSNQLDAAKKELSEAHALKFEDLKSSHAHQIVQIERTMEATYSEQLEALKKSHLQHIDDLKSSFDASHGEELKSLQVSNSHQIDDIKKEISAAHAAAVASLTESHRQELEDAKNSLHTMHSQELVTVNTEHAKQLEQLGKEKDTKHAAAIAALAQSHSAQIDEVTSTMSATHAEELQRIKAFHVKQLEDLEAEKDTGHATEISAMVESHSKQLASQRTEFEAIMSREIVALKTTHAEEIEILKNQHAAALAKELEGFEAALAKQVESSKAEGDAAHDEQIEALKAAHAKIIEVHIRDNEVALGRTSESLNSTHRREMDALRSEHAATRTKEMELITTKHMDELKNLRAEHASARAEELAALTKKHIEELKTLAEENEASKSQLLEQLTNTHLKELEALRQEIGITHFKELESLSSKHANILDDVKREHEVIMTRRIKDLENTHTEKIAELRRESEQTKSRELEALAARHGQIIDTLRTDHAADLARKLQDASEAHSHDLEVLRQNNELDRSRELDTLNTQHHSVLEKLKNDLETGAQEQLQGLKSAHSTALASLRAEHVTTLEQALSSLKSEHGEALKAAQSEQDLSQSKIHEELERQHSQQLDRLKEENQAAFARELDALNAKHAQVLESHIQESTIEKERLVNRAAELEEALIVAKNDRDLSQSRALAELKNEHSRELDRLKSDSDAAVARELYALNAQHAEILESHVQESIAEKERLLASHTAELEALRASLTIAPPALGYSSVASIQTEPIPSVKSPKHEAFVISHDERIPHSKQLSRETGANTDAPSMQKIAMDTTHQSAQTTLTAYDLEELIKVRRQKVNDGGVGMVPLNETAPATPLTVRVGRTSIDSLRSMGHPTHRVPESGAFVTPEPILPRRPGSSTSVRSATQNRPPLPTNHREVIEAARTHSSQGGKGTMGPPILPASAYRPSSRPETPSSVRGPVSSPSIRGAAASRASKTHGYADIHSPSRLLMRSRQSSISSFASEIDSRFNMQSGMGMSASGFGPSTDPRMIQAVTQTMIGEYLWKYTRKTGRGEMSEKRHRRFFWVHPYTRSLYWSDRDPAASNSRGEMKAKSVPIEAVRVVADDNPMPPGLHRKSLVVIAPGRTIKFTCTTGQRHETWFNALSYLLLRSGNESKQDAEEVAGNITQDDVDDFNPSLGRRSVNSHRARPPPSLSSYNSRTTRNDSPSIEAQMSIPTLAPTHERDAARSSTIGRLSGYWRSGRGTFSSLRSRSHQPYDRAIYEATEVPDSAEDMRQIIEQQDRDADKLENVRACCDGKHDVGTLPHTTKRGRLPNFQTHSHTHMHPALSSSQTAMSSSTRTP
ncbi:hypothetical protein GGR50DRAFT_610291 [Xylaria sp. CBS 124048]|nr:hypothetical protein GGR50DRAFT_610291 [Xylaria sp. CBS 124048]